MKASIIVPVRNGEQVIATCLQALRCQDLPAPDYEVIVVDDGSTDGTAEVVRGFPEVRLLQQPARGPAAARNHGVAEAQGEWILFTDADCAPHPGWAGALLRAAEESGAAGGKGVYATRQRSLVARFVQVEYETRYRRTARRASIDFVDTYSAVYQRAVLEEVGGFNERLPGTSLEDQELSFRVAARGNRLVFVPDAVVDHLHVSTVGAYARKKFGIGYWKVAVLAAHPSKALDDSHTPQTLKLEIALAGLLLISLPLSILGGAFRWAPLALVLALAGTWAPFVRYALRRDRPVGLIAPGMLLVRALALGSGLAWGLLHRRRLARLGIPAS